MNSFSGFTSFSVGGFDRDASMVYNNHGGKNKSKSKSNHKRSRSTSKPKYRSKYRAHKKSKRGSKRSRKGRSKSGKSMLNRAPKGRSGGRGKSGLAPGGTNIGVKVRIKPSITYRAKRINKPRSTPRMKRNAADL